MQIRRISLAIAGLIGCMAQARASCFDGQWPAVQWAQTAARSSVRLMMLRSDGEAFGMASGVVVARSGSGTDLRNRILTAGHVLRDLATLPGSMLAVTDSDGDFLGVAEAAAAAAPGPAFGLRDPAAPSGLRFGDMAVLRLQSSSLDEAARFAAIPGLALAPSQPGGLLRGDVADPAGVDPGVSGAGVLSADGTLLGIMAAKLEVPGVPKVAIVAGDPDGAGPRLLRLPLHAVGYATPIADPTILAALGHAGRAVHQARTPVRTAVVIAGYPRGACVVYRAHMGPT